MHASWAVWSGDATSGGFAPPVAAATELADGIAASAAALDDDGAFPTHEFAALGRAGLLRAPLAPERGGIGLGLGPARDGGHVPGSTHALLRVLEEVGRGNLAVGRLYEGHVNALLLIEKFGRPDQRDAWAADARAGRLFGVWNTQAADGVRFGPVGPDGRAALSGSKTFASGAGHVDRPIVTGSDPEGRWRMAVVPMDEVDARVDASFWRPLGMKASASHRVEFDGVRVDEAAFLGPPGAYLVEPWFTVGAIRFAAVQLGGARAIFDAAVATLRDFGRADDPYQRARIGSMAVALESGRQWLHAAGAVADGLGDDPDRATIGAAMAHAQMTRTAVGAICEDVLRLAEQSVGARGLLHPHPIERIGRDLTLYLRQPGPDAALAEVGRAWLEGESPPSY